MYSPTFVLIILAIGVALSLVMALLARRAKLLSGSMRKQVVISALMSAALLALITVFLAVRLHNPTPPTAPPQTLTVTVTFSTSSRTKELMNVPFSVSSSPVNVGCD
jgi:hypothetical protein